MPLSSKYYDTFSFFNRKSMIFFLYQNTISVHINYEAINKVIQLENIDKLNYFTFISWPDNFFG